jgi:hypothetical protein
VLSISLRALLELLNSNIVRTFRHQCILRDACVAACRLFEVARHLSGLEWIGAGTAHGLSARAHAGARYRYFTLMPFILLFPAAAGCARVHAAALLQAHSHDDDN